MKFSAIYGYIHGSLQGTLRRTAEKAMCLAFPEFACVAGCMDQEFVMLCSCLNACPLKRHSKDSILQSAMIIHMSATAVHTYLTPMTATMSIRRNNKDSVLQSAIAVAAISGIQDTPWPSSTTPCNPTAVRSCLHISCLHVCIHMCRHAVAWRGVI